ncbi:LppP/LprE family lipoprotein [Ornithinimicrobium sp. Y1847]|uniref:LppP/LprE family lipoprotein n=1 Tax=Ornithinimicrobium sp. Y1847 TaxID=3405419 RepID=UPI003B67A3EC
MSFPTPARTLLAACLAASLIAACGGSPDAAPSTATPDGPTQTHEPPAADDGEVTATSAPGDGAEDEAASTDAAENDSEGSTAAGESGRGAGATGEECGELSAQDAVERWIADVPPAFPETDPQDREAFEAWGTDNAETDDYDACADLSWINLNLVNPTGSSPTAIMLFHRGEFARPATRAPVSSGHEVERLADDQIAITYHYFKDTDTSAATQSGRARSVFTWDADEEAIVRTGDLPPGKTDGYEDSAGGDGSDAGGTAPDSGGGGSAGGGSAGGGSGAGTPPVPGAYAGGGGALPAGAIPATTFADGVAVIISPSGNIGCDLGQHSAGCGVVSWLHNQTFPGPHGDPLWWIDLTSGAEPSLLPKGDPAYFLHTNAQVIPYGSVVYSGAFACASQEAGFTCWNTTTGHGAFFNREGFWPF